MTFASQKVSSPPLSPCGRGRKTHVGGEMKMVDRHCVSVRFTEEELRKIDGYRGKIPRGTWCRKAILGKPVSVPPEPNRKMYAETARWAANLAQIAHHLNRGEAIEIDEIRRELFRFRRSLLGEDEKS